MEFHQFNPARWSKLLVEREESEKDTRVLLQQLEQEASRLGGARGDSFQEAAHGRAALCERYCRLKNRSKYLEEQLGLARQRLSVKQSELRAAHFRACEDRNNRQCDDCCLQRDVVLESCFHLVCPECSQRHMRCTSACIYSGTVREQLFSARASSLLDKISREVRTLQEGSWLTTSIWGKQYVVQDTRRLEENCGWLEQQLTNT